MAFIYHIIALLGGLSMFLYGMRVMGDGLKSNSGGAMKTVLANVTNKPILGFLLGVVVTCIIQSSTATIVLSVGLVGAGFLTFQQSIGIVLGANVGTAITAQIIRLMDLESAENSIMYFFKADNLAPLALIIGMVILMTTKRESKKNLGNVACGFGVLFMGLIFMSDAVSSFRESLSYLLTAFASNYFLGFGAGVLVTGIIQSSSAVVGIIQSIASSMGVTFNGVFAVIIGVNIGDCLTTFLVSRIGARPEQVRTAVVHVVYNICSATLIITALIIGRTTGLIGDNIWYANLNSGGVANVHGLFRVIPAIVILPFSGLLAKITEQLVKDDTVAVDDENSAFERELHELDPHLLSSPILAMDQVDQLITHMSDVAFMNFRISSEAIGKYDPAIRESFKKREDLLDRATDALGQYLIKMTPYIKRDRDFRLQNFQLKSSVCFERIGDCEMDIIFALAEMEEKGLAFSDSALSEMKILIDAVNEILTNTIDAYAKRDDKLANTIEPLEEVIDDIVADLHDRHVIRMSEGRCGIAEGLQFENIIASMATISDQCSDIAIYVQELQHASIRGREHDYIHKLHHSVDSDFQKEYQDKREKYFSRLAYLEDAVTAFEDGEAIED